MGSWKNRRPQLPATRQIPEANRCCHWGWPGTRKLKEQDQPGFEESKPGGPRMQITMLHDGSPQSVGWAVFQTTVVICSVYCKITSLLHPGSDDQQHLSSSPQS